MKCKILIILFAFFFIGCDDSEKYRVISNSEIDYDVSIERIREITEKSKDVRRLQDVKELNRRIISSAKYGWTSVGCKKWDIPASYIDTLKSMGYTITENEEYYNIKW